MADREFTREEWETVTLAEWRKRHPAAVRKTTRWGDVWDDVSSIFYPHGHPVRVADDALIFRCGMISEDLTEVEYNAVMVAVIDAEPEGREAQYQAVVDTLHGLAIAHGWQDEFLANKEEADKHPPKQVDARVVLAYSSGMSSSHYTDHPKYKALVAAVAASPADDLPRLVLCDWLEENAGTVPCPRHVAGGEKRFMCKVCGAVEDNYGRLIHRGRCRVLGMSEKKASNFVRVQVECATCLDSGVVSDWAKERAEFIRVGCELAKMVSVDPKCPNVIPRPGIHYNTFGPVECERCWPERDGLRHRELELWSLVEREFVNRDWLASCNYERFGNSYGKALVLVRRGFVSEVRCTLADWCGGECDNCVGSVRRIGIGRAQHLCEVCSGTGRTSAIGHQLVREHPIEKVVLTDREPGSLDNGWWYWGGNDEPGEPTDLGDLFEMLPGEPVYDGVTRPSKMYPTRDDAINAAATTAIRWAKSQPST